MHYLKIYGDLDESKFNKQNLYHHGVKRNHLEEYKYDPRFPDFKKKQVCLNY